MAYWNSDTCGYCGYSAPNLEKHECPECKRNGCLSCMSTGSSTPCDYCVEARLQQDLIDPGNITPR